MISSINLAAAQAYWHHFLPKTQYQLNITNRFGSCTCFFAYKPVILWPIISKKDILMLRKLVAISGAPSSMVLGILRKLDIFGPKMGVAALWALNVIAAPRPLKILVIALTWFVHRYYEVKSYRKTRLNPPFLNNMICLI